jgi:peptide/nickel transport system substrate-binding protein
VVLNPKAVSKLATAPVGSGPFQVQSMNRGYSVTLVRNAKYWGTPASVDKVVFRYYTDPNALINAMRAGDVDMLDNVPDPQQLKQFTGNNKFKVTQGYTAGEVVLSLDNAKPPLNNVLVRRAITYAINRKQLVQTAYAGYGKLIGTHASPGDPWFVDKSNYYPYDPAKAKQLLAKAGATNITLSLQLPPVNYARASGEFVAASLEQVGIHVTTTNVEWPLWLDQIFAKANYDMTIVAHVEARDIIKYADPNYYWRYNNPAVQKLIGQADSEPTMAKSIADYRRVEQIITNDAVNDWLFLLPNLIVARSDLSGYPTNVTGSLAFDLTGIKRAT